MTLDVPIHKKILIQILKDIYTDISICSTLGFKGGTAAYLFYGLPRLSVDLDFDLLDKTAEDHIFSRVAQIIKSYGKVKETRKKRFNLFFLLSYEEKAQNIKIEINRRLFGSEYEVRNYLGISMLVMKKEDMLAHKLVALTERRVPANRDIFDLHYFLFKIWDINEKIVESRTGKKLDEHLRDCIKHVEKIDNNQILQGLGELITEKQKHWTKENLKQNLIFQLKLRLESES